MAVKECPEAWEMKFTRAGASAHRELICDDWKTAYTDAPKPGEKYTGFELLTVDSVQFRGLGKPQIGPMGVPIFERARIIVDYTLEYKKPGRKDGPRVSWEYSCQVLETSGGRVWADTLKKIARDDVVTATFYPMMNVTIDMVMADPPWSSIQALVGKINTSAWLVYDIPIKGAEPKVILNVEAETLLFEGAQVTAEYNFDTSSWDTRLTYKFVWRPQSHNLAWRDPEYKLNGDGEIQYYQGVDAGKSNFTTNHALVNRPVFEDDYDSVHPGVGGWAHLTPELYLTGDFAALIPPP
jgi:hypothetical protein